MAFRVLGVDPGSSATGWALVAAEGNRFTHEWDDREDREVSE